MTDGASNGSRDVQRGWTLARVGLVLRVVTVVLAVLSFGADCGIYWTADYGGGVSPPDYLARDQVFAALLFPRPAYLALLAAPALVVALAVAVVAVELRLLSTASRRPRLGAAAAALLSLVGLAPISSDLDQTGTTSLVGVSAASPAEAWAVGSFDMERGGALGVIWHYASGRWSEVERPDQPVSAVAALPDGEAWAVGAGGTLMREAGGTWTGVTSPTGEPLLGVAMRSPTEGWAVGGSEHIPLAAAVRDDGTILAADDGTRPTCVILHDLGGRWSQVPCPYGHHLEAVTVLPDGEAWAVGLGAVLHEAGGAWQVVRTVSGTLTSVSMSGPGEGWATGYLRVVLHCHDGVWSPVPTPAPGRNLFGVAMDAGGGGWMDGDGTILRWDGAQWSPAVSPTPASLFGATVLPDGTAGWMVGAGSSATPVILGLRGGEWRVAAG